MTSDAWPSYPPGMSFLERCDGVGAGRRRIAQLSNEEWRAALQQQVQDKERQKALRPASGCEGGESQEACTGGVRAFDTAKLEPEVSFEVAENAEEALVAEAMTSIPRMGRRGVQQLSKEQWREALEQQIREKNQSKGQQQRNGSDEPLRRSYSAPQQEAKEEQLGFCPEREYQERAATTSSCDATSSQETGIRGRNRRAVATQSRELYLKSLQEQIEEKQKRLTQAEKDKEQQSHHQFRSLAEDDVAFSHDERRLSEERERGMTPPGARNVQQEAQCHRDESEDVASGRQSLPPSNQEDVGSHLSASAASTAAADPVAIAKIVDFCEELKKQNEDVKKQLLEQHSVLTSLRSTLVVGGGSPSSPSVDSRTRKEAAHGGARKSQLTPGKSSHRGSLDTSLSSSPVRRAQAKHSEHKVIPRPRPARGESKIPLPPRGLSSSLRAAGAQIVKGDRVEWREQHDPSMPHAEPKHSISARLEIILPGNKGSPAEALRRSASKADQAGRDNALVASLRIPECSDEHDAAMSMMHRLRP